MATLTNTKIKDTYDGLLKTTNNEAIGASGVTLIEDGLGNASALSVGRSGNGVSVSGLLDVTGEVQGTSLDINGAADISGNLAVDTNTLYVDASNNRVGIGKTPSSEKFEVNGAIVWEGALTASQTSAGVLDRSGDDLRIRVYGATAGSGNFVVRTGGGGGSADSERMRIDSSGVVNIAGGVLELASQAEIIGSSDNLKISADPDNVSGGSTIEFLVDGGEKMRINNSGNVGIGESNPVERLTIATAALDSAPEFISFNDTTSGSSWTNGQTYGGIRWRMTDGTGIGAHEVAEIRVDNTYTGAAGDGAIIFSTAPYNTTMSERMRITSGGDFIYNTGSGSTQTYPTSGSNQVHASGSTYFSIGHASGSASGNLYIGFGYNGSGIGSITQNGTSGVSFNTSSDYRLKENVVPMEGALDRVDALKPSRFNFIADADKTVDGFLAHEVQAIVPEAVTGEKDAVDEEGNPIYQGIDQSKIVPLLVGAIQELKGLVQAQQAEIELLKNK